MATNGPQPERRLAAVRKYVDSLGIKYDQLPQMPFWAPLLSYSHKQWKMQVAGKIWDSSVLIGRTLTQEETDALAEHYAKAIQLAPYGFPVSSAVGYALYRRTASSFKFPLDLSSTPKVDVNKFALLGLDGSRKPAQAILSRKIWALVRLGSWLLASQLSISILISLGVVFRYQKAYSNDTRLESFRQEALAHFRNGRQMQQSAFQPDNIQERENSTMEQQQVFSEQSPQDAQPTWTKSQARQPQVTQPSSNEEDPFVFDDASPIAPAQQTSPPQYNAQQGSAWDRLRAQARTGAPSQNQQGGTPTSAWERRAEDEVTSQAAKQGTSFNFSPGDETRAYAKGQAQREFDEMLERERRGDANARK